MLKKLLNQCTFEIELETEEPLLINSGDAVVGGADMTFVRTRRGGEPEPFLPGSSLKGVLRSHAERIARTLQEESVCGVFENADVEGCGWHFRELDQSSDDAHAYDTEAHYYQRSCPACRLFGSTHWKGRFHIGDAYLVEDDRDVEPELRDGIGIDRVSGGVAGSAKFDLEVMPAGVRFAMQFDLTNFETWQLGWMAYVLRDLMEGKLRVGMGTSRGLGRVQGHLQSISLEYVGEPEGMEESVLGLGALAEGEERRAYGLREDDRVESTDGVSPERPPASLRAAATLKGTEQQEAFLAAVAPAWNDYVGEAGRISERRS
jgi:CRISPR-associated RAMP protein (TIGR02581 family)